MFCTYTFASCLVVCFNILHLQFAFRLQFVASSILALSYFRVLAGIMACSLQLVQKCCSHFNSTSTMAASSDDAPAMRASPPGIAAADDTPRLCRTRIPIGPCPRRMQHLQNQTCKQQAPAATDSCAAACCICRFVRSMRSVANRAWHCFLMRVSSSTKSLTQSARTRARTTVASTAAVFTVSDLFLVCCMCSGVARLLVFLSEGHPTVSDESELAQALQAALTVVRSGNVGNWEEADQDDDE